MSNLLDRLNVFKTIRKEIFADGHGQSPRRELRQEDSGVLHDIERGRDRVLQPAQ